MGFGTTNKQHLDEVNWDEACFPLGVKAKDGKGRPWLELDEYDVQLLRLFLTRKFKTDDGAELPPAIDTSDTLMKLYHWLGAAEAHLTKK